jgi:hypothetical protein
VKHRAFHLPAVALGAALLIPLFGAASATARTEVRHHGPAAVHRMAGGAAHSAYRGVVTGRRVAGGGGRTYVSTRRFAYGSRHYRYGYSGAAVTRGAVGYGYASSYGGGGYGYSYYHSCGWYYRHEPYNIPYRCRGSYGYGSSYGYGYASGPSYAYGYQTGGYWSGGHYYRHAAVNRGWQRTTRAVAGVTVHGGPRVAYGGPRIVAHGGPHMVARGGPHMAARVGVRPAGGGMHGHKAP